MARRANRIALGLTFLGLFDGVHAACIGCDAYNGREEVPDLGGYVQGNQPELGKVRGEYEVMDDEQDPGIPVKRTPAVLQPVFTLRFSLHRLIDGSDHGGLRV